MTFRRDLATEAGVRTGLSKLSDEVAKQPRRHGLKGSVVYVQKKMPTFANHSRQTTLNNPTYPQKEIYNVAFQLVRDGWGIGSFSPIRAFDGWYYPLGACR